jgi:hypothetical protein
MLGKKTVTEKENVEFQIWKSITPRERGPLPLRAERATFQTIVLNDAFVCTTTYAEQKDSML